MEMNIVLIGFMGAGKTTVGQQLAAKLERPFVDTDDLIEAQAGLSVDDIFAREGEAGFRHREADVVREVARKRGQIIAVGGGTLARRDNVRRLRDGGVLVWLRAPRDVLLRRATRDGGRPLLRQIEPTVDELYAAREPVYSLADIIVDTDDTSPAEVAAAIADKVAHPDDNVDAATVSVRLPEQTYEVYVGTGVLGVTGRRCAELNLGERALLITNPTVGALYGTDLQRSLAKAGVKAPRVDVPDGEQHKTLDTVAHLYETAVGYRMERGSFFISLGGGVLGDTAGFAAASYVRGVDFVQVPTTLLAQVDASVGGKVGVNLPQGKNLVGAFHQPRLVVADVDTLTTLPRRHLVAGLAEVIKYGAIADPHFLDFIEDRLDDLLALRPGALVRAVARSVRIKANIVAADELETEGVREQLNFGHTIGHALEALGEYDRLLHGEAVAVGMVTAAMLSERLGGLAGAHVKRLVTLLRRAGLPIVPDDVDEDELLSVVGHDKKVRRGRPRFVLLDTPGEPFITDEVSDELVTEIVREQRSYE